MINGFSIDIEHSEVCIIIQKLNENYIGFVFSRMFIYSVFNGGCSTKVNGVLKCAFEGKIHPLSL